MCHYLNAKKKWSLPFISVVMLAVISFTSLATTVEELEIENEQLEIQLDEAEDETESLEVLLGEINSEILEINEELESINDMIEITEAQMGKTLDDLAASKLEEEQQYENMKVRIRYMYEAGNATFLEMLMGAESLVDFVNKTEFISNVTEYDRDMLEELTAIREEIEFEEETLLDEQAALVDLQVDAELKAEELQEKADETETDLVAVQALIQEIESEQAVNEAEQAAIIAAQQAEAEAQTPQVDSSTGNSSSDSSSSDSSSSDSSSSNSGSSDSSSSDSNSSNSGSSYEGSSSEVDLLAALLDCEAISDYNAMLAVATVVMNRVESSRFPNTLSGVVYESGQFSPTWTGKLDRVLASGASSLAYQVAEDAMNGARVSSVSNCYYFLYAGGTSRTGVEIGGNVFFVSW